MEKNLFQADAVIRPDEVDQNGLAGVRTIGHLFQDAAARHAASLGFGFDSLGREGKAWVLSRLYLAVSRPPRYGERVTVKTWPAGLDRLFALRDFLLNDETGVTLAWGVSAWCIVNLDERRIERPPRTLEQYGSLARAGAHTLKKLEADRKAAVYEKALDARYRDIDLNSHVNNVAFLEWLCEALPFAFLSSSFCRELEINFLKEAFYGDVIRSSAVPLTGESSAFSHALRRLDEQEDLARAVTRWAPC